MSDGIHDSWVLVHLILVSPISYPSHHYRDQFCVGFTWLQTRQHTTVLLRRLSTLSPTGEVSRTPMSDLGESMRGLKFSEGKSSTSGWEPRENVSPYHLDFIFCTSFHMSSLRIPKGQSTCSCGPTFNSSLFQSQVLPPLPPNAHLCFLESHSPSVIRP